MLLKNEDVLLLIRGWFAIFSDREIVNVSNLHYKYDIRAYIISANARTRHSERLLSMPAASLLANWTIIKAFYGKMATKLVTETKRTISNNEEETVMKTSTKSSMQL